MGRSVFARVVSLLSFRTAMAFVLVRTAGDTRVVAGAVDDWRNEGEGDSPDGLPRRLDAGVLGLFPLLRTISPLLLDAPPNAIKAPSRAALLAMSLLLAVEGAREGLLCVPVMPQRSAGGSRRSLS
jgi:hypothetical protein